MWLLNALRLNNHVMIDCESPAISFSNVQIRLLIFSLQYRGSFLCLRLCVTVKLASVPL
jgi:hypothetical protein